MVKVPEVLALVPARGGSKGIPRKNIRDFAGYPLIAYSILAGLRAKLVTRVIVSTEDLEIAEVAKAWDADVPFLRPQELAQDQSLDLPVMQHALKWLVENEDYHPEIVVWLRPTSPLRPLNCVDDAVTLLLEHPEADSVRGVVPAGQNPYKMWRVDQASGVMTPLISVEGIREAYNAPRQVLPQAFWQTGHIDAIRSRLITERNTPTGDVILPLFIDPRYTVDIDKPSDWQGAEALVKDGHLDMVDPASRRRQFPAELKLLVMDFDGVLTDNRVWVDQDGHESVAANRSDSLGLDSLRANSDIELLVISKETNPVVTARCKKLGIPVFQSVSDKGQALKEILRQKKLNPQQVMFIGNDTNDLPAFEVAGYAVVPADAHPSVARLADLVLTHNGGHGAVRELCDLILSKNENKRKL